MRPSPQLESSEWLWLIASLARLYHKPFDAQLLQQQYPPPYDTASLRTALHGRLVDHGLDRIIVTEQPRAGTRLARCCLEQTQSGG